MPATPQEYLQKIQANRSSESNFETLCAILQEAINTALGGINTSLADALKEVDEKYVSAYKKAREVSGNAWPEFEKFVAQFERVLVDASKEGG